MKAIAGGKPEHLVVGSKSTPLVENELILGRMNERRLDLDQEKVNPILDGTHHASLIFSRLGEVDQRAGLVYLCIIQQNAIDLLN